MKEKAMAWESDDDCRRFTRAAFVIGVALKVLAAMCAGVPVYCFVLSARPGHKEMSDLLLLLLGLVAYGAGGVVLWCAGLLVEKFAILFARLVEASDRK